MPRRLDARDPASRDAAVAAAAALLRAGSLVAFPTETVYGLGARAGDASAVARVFALKGRPAWHPLIVHLGDAEQIGAWAAEVPEAARRLAEAFWPGPLTLVVRARDDVPAGVTGGAPTVALRVPGHPLALALLQALGEGVAAPSANRYGRLSPTRAEHVLAEFEHAPLARGEALAVLDGGPCSVGLESTIVDLTGAQPRLLRPGGLAVGALERVVGRFASAFGGPRPPAPGDRPRHYAPDVETRLVDGPALATAPHDVAVLARRAAPPGRPPTAASWLDMGVDPVRYGQQLYAALRQLEAERPRAIWVERVPQEEPWGAVADRLARATSAVGEGQRATSAVGEGVERSAGAVAEGTEETA